MYFAEMCNFLLVRDESKHCEFIKKEIPSGKLT